LILLEEDIHYAETPVMFKNRPFLFVFCLLLSLVGIGLIIFLIWFLKTKALKLTVTDKRVILREGLLRKNLTEIFIDDVKRVQSQQSFLQRFFNVGSVTVSSAATGYTEIYISGIPDPQKAKNFIIKQKNEKTFG